MEPVKHSELLEMLGSEGEAREALETYFEIDSDGAFSFSYRIREGVSIIDDRDEAELEGFALTTALRIANNYQKKVRKKRFERLVVERPESPVIVSEGDSWFNHPLLRDTIDFLFDHYNIRALGEAGDTLRRMTHPNTREYLDAIRLHRPAAFVFSGIGNDILGDITRVVRPFDPDSPPSTPHGFLSDGFVKALGEGLKAYQDVAEELIRSFPGIRMFVHGYDYAVPGAGSRSPWLKTPMTKKLGIPEEAQPDIVRVMIDDLNHGLRLLADEVDNLVYVDCRSAAEQPWDDEIHPTEIGYAHVAERFHLAIQSHL